MSKKSPMAKKGVQKKSTSVKNNTPSKKTSTPQTTVKKSNKSLKSHIHLFPFFISSFIVLVLIVIFAFIWGWTSEAVYDPWSAVSEAPSNSWHGEDKVWTHPLYMFQQWFFSAIGKIWIHFAHHEGISSIENIWGIGSDMVLIIGGILIIMWFATLLTLEWRVNGWIKIIATWSLLLLTWLLVWWWEFLHILWAELPTNILIVFFLLEMWVYVSLLEQIIENTIEKPIYVSALSFLSALIDAIGCWAIMNWLFANKNMSRKWLVHGVNMTWIAGNAVVIWALPNIAFVASYHISLVEFSMWMFLPAVFWVIAYSMTANTHDFRVKNPKLLASDSVIPRRLFALFAVVTALHIFLILWHEALHVNLAFAALPGTIILLLANFLLPKDEHKIHTFKPSEAEFQAWGFILTLAWVVSIAMASWLLAVAWDQVTNLVSSWMNSILVAFIIFFVSAAISSVFDNIVWAAVLWIVMAGLASGWLVIPWLVIFASIAGANCGWMFTKIWSGQWVNAWEVLEHKWEWVSVFGWTVISWKPALAWSIVVFVTLVSMSFLV